MSRKHKIVVLSFLSGILVCVVMIIVYILPRNIDVSVDGILYRLGSEHQDLEQPVTMHIEGKLRRTVLGEQKFQGTLDIEGIKIPVDKQETLAAVSGNTWVITYAGVIDGRTYLYSLGILHVNNKLSQFTLLLHSNDGVLNHAQSRHWGAEDGLTISAPASTRAEALAITEQLLEESYGNLFSDLQ